MANCVYMYVCNAVLLATPYMLGGKRARPQLMTSMNCIDCSITLGERPTGNVGVDVSTRRVVCTTDLEDVNGDVNGVAGNFPLRIVLSSTVSISSLSSSAPLSKVLTVAKVDLEDVNGVPRPEPDDIRETRIGTPIVVPSLGVGFGCSKDIARGVMPSQDTEGGC